MVSRQHLDDCTAKAPDIGTPAIACLSNDLRRHPEHRSPQRLHAIIDRCALVDLAGAKVGNLDGTVARHQDVGSFDVSMYDLAPVQVFESEQQLPRVVSHQLLVELAEAPQHRCNGASRHCACSTLRT
eukprot:364426-Chlamydomonas_euryale.AAC.3